MGFLCRGLYVVQTWKHCESEGAGRPRFQDAVRRGWRFTQKAFVSFVFHFTPFSLVFFQFFRVCLLLLGRECIFLEVPMADDVNVVTATSACPNVRVLHLPPPEHFSKNPSKVWLIDSCRGSAMPARVEKLCLLESGWCPFERGLYEPGKPNSLQPTV